LICFTLAFAGDFQAPTNYPVNPYPTGIVAGDFNRDGKLDLVITVCGDANCVAPSAVQVLLGNGTGQFAVGGVFAAGAQGTSADTLATGDFNGDGIPDVAVVTNGINRFGNVSILLGDGNGGFLPPVFYPVGGSSPVWVVVADFNGDHVLDLALSMTTNDAVSILRGKGDGTFGPATLYPVETGPQGITVGDVNGDGSPDVVAANQCGVDPKCSQGTVSILLNNGNGTFQPAISFGGGLSPLSVTTADFNGDNHSDIAVADSCGTDPKCVSDGAVGVLLGNGDGTFQPLVSYPATGPDTARLMSGDINGDRHPDVVALDAQFTDFTFFLGNGDGTLQAGVDYTAGLVPIWAVIADFNGDRASDLAVVNEFSSDVSVFLNSGGTRITLTSNPNPSKVGEPVTFTAIVTPTLAGYGVPTGTIRFTTSGKTIGTAQLSNGTASVMTSRLPAGTHQIRANYLGDQQYNPTNSPPHKQVVNP